MVVLKSPTNRRPRMARSRMLAARIKQNPLACLSRRLIERVCRDHDHVWRDRELDPATTVSLFIQQIVHGNIPCSQVRHIAHASFSAQAYCQAPCSPTAGGLSGLGSQGLRRGVAAVAAAANISGTATACSTSMVRRSPCLIRSELRKAFGMPSGQKAGCGIPGCSPAGDVPRAHGAAP